MSPFLVMPYAAVVSLYLAFLGPLNIYIYNSEEFSSSPSELIGVLLLITGVFFFLLLALLHLPPRRFSKIFFRIIAIGVLGAWIFSTFLYGEYGRLDGTPLTIERWGLLALAQSVVLLGLIFLSVNVSLEVIFRLVGLVFVISLITAATNAFTLDSKEKKKAITGLPASLTQFSPEKNVLHVVLDELGSDLFSPLWRAIES